MPGKHVTVVIYYSAQADKQDEALKELTQLVETVVSSEPDCLSIDILRDTAEPTRILLYEKWTSKEAFTGEHLRTAHILKFIEKAPTLFAGPPDITFWEFVE